MGLSSWEGGVWAWDYGGVGSPFNGYCRQCLCLDCDSVGSSTARWSHVASCLYHGVSSLVTMAAILSWWDGWPLGGPCRWCTFYRTFLLVLWTSFYLCVWHVCVLYVLYVICFSCVYMCPRVSIWMNVRPCITAFGLRVRLAHAWFCPQDRGWCAMLLTLLR